LLSSLTKLAAKYIFFFYAMGMMFNLQLTGGCYSDVQMKNKWTLVIHCWLPLMGKKLVWDEVIE
jgi:hypothetical protein